MTALQIIGLILLIPGLGFFALLIYVSATTKQEDVRPPKGYDPKRSSLRKSPKNPANKVYPFNLLG